MPLFEHQIDPSKVAKIENHAILLFSLEAGFYVQPLQTGLHPDAFEDRMALMAPKVRDGEKAFRRSADLLRYLQSASLSGR